MRASSCCSQTSLVLSLELLLEKAKDGSLRSFVGTGICSGNSRVAVQHFGDDVSPLMTIGALRLLSSCAEDSAYIVLDHRAAEQLAEDSVSSLQKRDLSAYPIDFPHANGSE